MNQSLHLYLTGLVGNAQQLVITADNARIPLDLSCGDQSTVSSYGTSEDCSMHSRFSSYSGSHSYTLGLDSSTGSQNSSSRWDSQVNSRPTYKVRSKQDKPKKPMRRQNSGSLSPTPAEYRSNKDNEDLDHCRRRRRISGCFGENDEKDVDRRSSRRQQQQQEITLKGVAASVMLRMPQRRASNDGNRKQGQVKSQRRSQNPRRPVRRNSQQKKTRRHVGEILGEAIHALDMEGELAGRGALTIKALQ